MKSEWNVRNKNIAHSLTHIWKQNKAKDLPGSLTFFFLCILLSHTSYIVLY